MKRLIPIILIVLASCSKQEVKPSIQKEVKQTRNKNIRAKCCFGFGSGCKTYIGICKIRIEHNLFNGISVYEWKALLPDTDEQVDIIEVNGCKTIAFSKDGDIYANAVKDGKLYIGQISIEDGLGLVLQENTSYELVDAGYFVYIKN